MSWFGGHAFGKRAALETCAQRGEWEEGDAIKGEGEHGGNDDPGQGQKVGESDTIAFRQNSWIP